MIRWLGLHRRLSGDGGASIGNACPPMTSPPTPPGNVVIVGGNAGDDVGLVGHGFGPNTGTIHVGSHTATVTAWTDTYVQITLPDQDDFAVTTTITLTREDGHTTTLPAFLTDTFSLAAHISSLSAAGGPAGLTVTITGTHFEATQGTGGVTFHGVAATVSSWSNTSIIVTVPAQLVYPDTGNVVVTTGEGSVSNGVSFETVPDPSLTSLNHATGQPGSSLTLTGTHFRATQGTGGVLVDGVAATVTAWANTSVTVTVPSQGGTSASYPVVGIVTLTTGLGRSTPELKAFTTTVPSPVIASLNHATGQPGDSLTLTGTFFGATQGAGSVTVDGVSATVTAWAEAAVTVTVPTQGGTSASYPVVGTVGLTTNDGLASNTKAYTTTVPTPVLASLSVGTGQAGSALTLTGTFFGAAQGAGGVTVHGTAATVTAWAEASVTITVPTFGSYPDTGNVVLTTNGLLVSNGISYTTTTPYNAVGYALFNGGANQHADLTDAAYNGGGAFTVAGWLKPSAGFVTCDPFAHWNGTDGGWALRIPTSNWVPRLFVYNSAMSAANVAAAAIGGGAGDTNWHFFVLTYDGLSGGVIQISMDNAAFVTGNMTGTMAAGARAFQLGANPLGGGGTLKGGMDSVGYWSRVLTITDVGHLYNGGAGLGYPDLAAQGLTTGLVSYLDCADLTGQNLTDGSGNSHTFLGQNGASTYTPTAVGGKP